MPDDKTERMIPERRRGRIGKLSRRIRLYIVRFQIVNIIGAEKHLLFVVDVKIKARYVRIVFNFVVGIKAETGGVQTVADLKTVCPITDGGIGENRKRGWITAGRV